MPEQKFRKQTTMVVERKACFHVASAFLSRSELIWTIFRLKISKMSKNAFLASKRIKIDSVNGLKAAIRVFIC